MKSGAEGCLRIERLPSDVLIEILAWVDKWVLSKVAATSKRMRHVALQDALWKRHVLHIVQDLSPPAKGACIQPYTAETPLWHAEHRRQALVTDPTSWPKMDEFVTNTGEHIEETRLAFSLDVFPGAQSYYQVYATFLKKCEPLLGWWAANSSDVGMAIRIVLDMDHVSGSSRPEDTMRESSGPALVCQRVHLTNRLQGLGRDLEAWSLATGYPIPNRITVMGNGTMLARSRDEPSTDVCEPGIKAENLWVFTWADACQVPAFEHAHLVGSVSNPSWKRGLEAVQAAGIDGPMPQEDLDAILASQWLPPRGTAEAEVAYADALNNVRHRFVIHEPVSRHGDERLIYRRSRIVVTRPISAGDGLVEVYLQPNQVYKDVELQNEEIIDGTVSSILFPPPALLSAIRSPPQDLLARRVIGRSGIFEDLSFDAQYLLDGKDLLLPSMSMDPLPPTIHVTDLASRYPNPRLTFYPIRNPARISVVPKPIIKRQAISASVSSSRPEELEYEHIPSLPSQNPAAAEFDWALVEGLYSMTYGPHGQELIYVRARALTLLDFGADESLPEWPFEPNMRSDDMYLHMPIDRRSATRIGARVLEGVKVLGDNNVPRGQITWRAFIDDPNRSATKWRPPPKGYRRHTPWPLRAPHTDTDPEMRSPGLVIPAHGRVAAQNFTDPGWAPALANVCSPDEIQIWWQSMQKVAVARKLIGV